MTVNDCLLYTSDAADERSSVDLGGRRIIKKKKRRDNKLEVHMSTNTTYTTEPRETINEKNTNVKYDKTM